MESISLQIILQVLVAFGLLNVWLIRPGRATSYRGGDALSLKEEFAAYGLPDTVFYVVGLLKIGAAVALLIGIWMPALVQPAAGIVAVLMIGALAMHVKVGDPLLKSVPAFLILLMSGAILLL